MSNEVGFTGEITGAQCECHKGQFLASAYFIHPEHGLILQGQTFFKTLEEGKEHLQGFVASVAQDFFKQHKIDIDKAKTIRVSENDEAYKDVRRILKTEKNENLH